jgi:hypothetical protein
MQPLPATTLRKNLASWAVPIGGLPSAVKALLDRLPPESYDKDFLGQDLETVYFDTRKLDLRKARKEGKRYLTLRLRCYDRGDEETYALSAKTESEKWREEIDEDAAHAILSRPDLVRDHLPANLQARLEELADDAPLLRAVTVLCTRYAVEDREERITLDVDVSTDRGKRLPCAVCEFKSSDDDSLVPASLDHFGSLKLSKFLWATEV